jgi:hypothetical protein
VHQNHYRWNRKTPLGLSVAFKCIALRQRPRRSKYLLSRAVRDAGYKVVYTGEGSDEIMYRLTLLARLRLENQVAVVTGSAATAIFAKAGPNLQTELVERTPEIVQPWIAERCPIGRSGLPADNANAALWLASSESSFVTGHALVVDGGITAGRRWSEQHQLDERLTERFRSAMAQT